MSPFTIVIPVYNEEALLVPNTERLVAYLDRLGPEYEILIGSNGSTDSTSILGAELSRRFQQLRFFHLPERGVGLAFKLLVEQARYPAIISIDMDLSTDLLFIPQALTLLERGDVVVGAKRLGMQQRPWPRKLGSALFLLTVRLLLGIGYDDYSMTAKAYRADRVRQLLPLIDRGSSYVLTICLFTERTGGEVIQVPVSCVDRRTSRFNLLQETHYKLLHLIRLWVQFRFMRLGRGS